MDDLIFLCKEQCNQLELSKLGLEYSFVKSKELIESNKNSYSLPEQDILEAFASRMARTADILVSKLLKTIQLFESEKQGTIRDLLLQSEKKGIIEMADNMIEIRLFRNEIAHEYLPNSEISIAKTCLNYTPMLLNNVNSAINYCKNNIINE